jgi:serine/threonine protein kinase
MTIDLTMRLSAIGTVLAARMPNVLDAVIALLESVLPAFDPTPPERYDIKHQIGTGGMADVLLGTLRGAEGFHRPVAIKRVRSDSADAGRFAARLIEEADLAALLSHPNVVSVLDLDRDTSGRLFLVMEHVDGVNLGQLIETGPLPYPVAIFIVRELLSGLGYIHEHRGRGGARGLMHRDVTPRNVLLSWEGAVKLADFGLALPLEGARTGVDMAGGTPGYMSPEQAHRQALDGRSDLYAVGIVLWEILALRRLRVGAPGDLSARVVFQDIPRPSEHRQDIPADLEAVTMRLLTYDQEERYRTAELAAHDLMRCQDIPRDGRGDLVGLLDQRFPRPRRRRPSSLAEEPRTVSDSMDAAPAPWPKEDGDLAAMLDLDRVWRRRRRQMLALGVLLTLVLAATIALLVAS